MNLKGKKAMVFAARFCILAVMAIFLMKLLGRDIGDNVVPLIFLVVASNAISYVIYKPKS